MRTSSASSARRRVGFTLIELLVVIAIIGILVSLLMAAVMKTMSKMEEVRTRNDITQLSQAVDSFKTKFHVGYIPSQIKLCEDYLQYGNTQLDLDSKAYIAEVWPRITKLDGSGRTIWNTSDGLIDWDGSGTRNGPHLLNGAQCLVFFLGGIPTTAPVNGCLGFSTNPTNPADPAVGPGRDRITFFDFQSNRLVNITYNAGGRNYNNRFFAYKDAYGKNVYAYFSSYKTSNGYWRYGITDCLISTANAGQNAYPYWESANRFLNPNTFQIISAGPDGLFTDATPPPPNAPIQWRQGQQNFSPNQAGYDNMSNFSDRPLGIPTN